MAGADTWPARLLLLDATQPPTPALTQLSTSSSSTPAPPAPASSSTPPRPPQRASPSSSPQPAGPGCPHAGLDLVAVGLTSDEAQGCAALLAASTDLRDAPMPVDDTATEGWRSFTDQAGALRGEHTQARHTPPDQLPEPTATLLGAPGPGVPRHRRHNRRGSRHPRPGGTHHRARRLARRRPHPRRRPRPLARRRLPPPAGSPSWARSAPAPAARPSPNARPT